MANIWEKAIQFLAGNLYSGLCYLIYKMLVLLSQLYNQAHVLIIISFFILELIEDDPQCNETWGLWWYITGYVAMGGLGLLALWEIVQFVGKAVNCEVKEYLFSGQNMVDLLMIGLSTAFFFLEYNESCPLHNGSKYINSFYLRRFALAFFYCLFFPPFLYSRSTQKMYTYNARP